MKPVRRIKTFFNETARMSILPVVCGALSAGMLFSACERTPENVLGKEAMASLLADLHMGEAVVDYNYDAYPNDSARKTLKQSIYAAHGVDQALVDTSFGWYGNHIEDYIKVCDRTIEIIQERQRDIASASSSQIAIAGDSVVIWNGGHLVVTDNMPSRVITFSFSPDSTWQKGDIFMLRYKPVNSNVRLESRVAVDYTNGLTAYMMDAAEKRSAMVQHIQVDSTLVPRRVYGYLSVPEGSSGYEIDSIAVIRMRHYVLPGSYIGNRRFGYGLSPEELRNANSLTRDVVGNNADTTMSDRENDVPLRRNPVSSHEPGTRMTRQSGDLPVSSSEREQTEHRKNAAEHKVTPESRRQAASRHQLQSPSTQRRQLRKTN